MSDEDLSPSFCTGCGEDVGHLPYCPVPTRTARVTVAGNGPVANNYQHSGDHYRTTTTEQLWDRLWSLCGPAWFVGNATKYTERYRLKGGVVDLEKARHYLQKLIELERAYATGGPAPGVFGGGTPLQPLTPEML